MTMNILVLKGDLNGKIVVVRFFFLSGIYTSRVIGRSYMFAYAKKAQISSVTSTNYTGGSESMFHCCTE